MKNKNIDFNTKPLTAIDALFLLFLGLKLAKVITWSWLWVFAPIWGSVIIAIIIAIISWRSNK